MYQVSVHWAPAHELISSLGVYLERKLHKLIDLGPAWPAEVRRQLDPSFAEELAGGIDADYWPLHLLVTQHPGEADGDTFLAWLEAMEPGELYERIAPHRYELAPPIPGDLRGYRDEVVSLLRRWNQQYFSKIDPAILTQLAAEAAHRRDRVSLQTPQEAVEEATNGIVLEEIPEVQRIILIPGYHERPTNGFSRYRTFGMYTYGADIPDSDLALMRLVRTIPDESRIRILRFVCREERTFMEIVRHTGLALSTVHHHLVALRGAGLLRVRESNPHPGASRQNTARYSFRPAALQRLGQRLTDMIYGGDPT